MIADKNAHVAFLEDALARHQVEFDLWKSNGYPQPLLDLFQKDIDTLVGMIETVKKEIK